MLMLLAPAQGALVYRQAKGSGPYVGRDRRELPAAGPLRADPPPPSPEASGRCPRRGLDDRQCRELEPGRPDAARRPAAADGAAAFARPAELGLARIRHA